MKDLNTILVATDLSEPSLAAISRGLMLAELHGVECTVLSVMPRDLVFSLQGLIGPSASKVEGEALQKQTQILNQTVTRLLDGRELDVVTRLRIGQPAIEISEQAEEDEVDLIVMASEGTGTVKRLLIGSTTMGVLQTSPAPVLVVKTQDTKDYDVALLLIDFSNATPAVIRTAMRYAPDAKYVFTHLLETPLDEMTRLSLIHEEQVKTLHNTALDQATEKLINLATQAGIEQENFSVEVIAGNIETALPALQKKVGAKLMVTGKQGHNATRDRLLGSFTQSVLNTTETDVLVAHPRGHDEEA